MKTNKLCQLLLGVFLCGLSYSAVAAETVQPYFASLKHDRVNLRTGPESRFPVLWVYTQKNYPVEVIDAHDLWRQIREIDGTTGWVHQAMLRPKRHILVINDSRLKNKPSLLGRPIAYVEKGTIGSILKCPADTPSCLLEFSKGDETVKGWLKKNTFFGVYPDEVIE